MWRAAVSRRSRAWRTSSRAPGSRYAADVSCGVTACNATAATRASSIRLSTARARAGLQRPSSPAGTVGHEDVALLGREEDDIQDCHVLVQGDDLSHPVGPLPRAHAA